MVMREEGSPLVLLITGAIAALVGGGIWAGITIVTGYEVGWVAWGVGLLVGVGVVAGGRGHPLAPPAAAGFAVLGLVVGKLMIVQFGAGAGFAAEVAADDDLMVDALLEIWADRGEIGRDVIDAAYGEAPVTPEIERKMIAAYEDAANEIPGLSAADRRAIADEYVDKLLARMTLTDKLDFGLFDLLWFGLAVVTAFRVAAAERA